MSKTIGQFDHDITKMNKGDALPFNPHVILCLKSYGRTRDGAPTISPHLMGAEEIDEYIKLLKADLDVASVAAKRALKSAKEQTLAIMSERSLS